MKIEHKAKSFLIEEQETFQEPWTFIPHECNFPNCPGNRNRLKLEMFDEMLAALEKMRARLFNPFEVDNQSADYKPLCDLITKAKELK